MQANLTGLEKIFLDSWEGWDGDVECLMFYDVNIKETFLQKNNIIIPKDCGKIDCTVFVNKCVIEFSSETSLIATFTIDDIIVTRIN